MKLYGYFRSSAAYRVRIALNLKGLAMIRSRSTWSTASSAAATTSPATLRGWCRHSRPTTARG